MKVKSGEYFSYHIPGIINHIVKLGVGIELCDRHYWHHETADFIFVAAENGVRLIYQSYSHIATEADIGVKCDESRHRRSIVERESAIFEFCFYFVCNVASDLNFDHSFKGLF